MRNKRDDQHSLKTELGFFYGYVIVFCCFLIMLVAGGALWSFGVFLKPLLKDFGWTRTTIAGAFSLQQILSGAVFIVSGRLNDRFGPRVVLSACGFFMGLGFFLMSQVKAVWHIYLFYGVLVGIGIGFSYVPMVSTVARWFVNRRALMTGVTAAGAGVGAIMMPPAATWIISNYGWRNSYSAIAVTVFAVILVIAQLLKRDPSLVGQLPDGEKAVQEAPPQLAVGGLTIKKAMRTRQFWLFSLAYFGYAAIYMSIVVHIVAHAIGLGIAAIMAASILSMNGGVSTVGKFLFGGMGDRLGNKSTLIIAFILATSAMVWLLLAKEMWMFYAFAVIFGLSYAGTATMQSPSVAWLFGLRSHGAILGVISFVVSIGSAMGPLVASYIFDTTGRYQLFFLIGAAISGISLILTSLLTPIEQSWVPPSRPVTPAWVGPD